ncbi:tocopherol cyclase family protein [Acholeplasma granularum]|uniref:tocopherol cyclase family protein n=1 Tax=Acholeplasma granularum TaxID=264635 RepID=UPI0004724BAE|nr:tocopherol cyclase family protein [Acholeplasma granularum]
MKNVFKDDRFQGFKNINKYFEGWYFKVVSKNQKQSLALIPGISKALDDAHAFIQVFVYSNDKVKQEISNHYFRFDINDFYASKNTFSIKIKDNYFSLEGVSVNLISDDVILKGSYKISNPVTLPKSLYQPSIMGPFAYLPKMECYHGILSMNHDVSGVITYNHLILDFNDCKGYVEKDYGRSFPSQYVWIQANHFDDSNTSFFLSVATIPYLKLQFDGFIVNLYHNRKHYRFATYNLSKIKFEKIKEKEVTYQFKKGKYILDVKATINEFGTLAAPKFGKMDHKIKEGLSGNVIIKLSKGENIIFHGKSLNAGIEIMKKKTLSNIL